LALGRKRESLDDHGMRTTPAPRDDDSTTTSVGAAQLLAAERARVAGLVAALQTEGSGRLTDDVGTVEIGAASQHPADVATDTFERERDLTILADARVELDEVDAAIARLAGGVYGTCERCGRPIGAERLGAVPDARFCRPDEERYELTGPATERVGVLLVERGYHAGGACCERCNLVTTRRPGACPCCPGRLGPEEDVVPVAVQAAVQQGAEVLAVAPGALGGREHIAALCRY
jgi:RNA polymerase-binding transcription factor DksA